MSSPIIAVASETPASRRGKRRAGLRSAGKDGLVPPLTAIKKTRTKTVSPLQATALKELAQIPGLTAGILTSNLSRARILTKKDPMYENIRTYVRNSQDHNFGLKVLNIIRISRKFDSEFENNPDPAVKSPFRMLLWHGTTATCISSILLTGFQRPVFKNQMFGTGIYFADRASKSANYCRTSMTPGSTGYLFLCDVILGKVYNAKNPHHLLTAPPQVTTVGRPVNVFDSVKCTGKQVPHRDSQIEFEGSVIPLGITISNYQFPSYSVLFNEYVVYKPEQVKPMYLVKFEFTQTPWYL